MWFSEHTDTWQQGLWFLGWQMMLLRHRRCSRSCSLTMLLTQCVAKCCEKFMNITSRVGMRFGEFYNEVGHLG